MKKVFIALILAVATGCVSTDNIRQYEPMKMDGTFVGKTDITIEAGGETVELHSDRTFMTVSQMDTSMQYWGLTALPVSSKALIGYDDKGASLFINLWTSVVYSGEATIDSADLQADVKFLLVDMKTNEVSEAGGYTARFVLSEAQPFTLGEDSLLGEEDASITKSLPQIVHEIGMRPDILRGSVNTTAGPIVFSGENFLNIEEALAAVEAIP